MRFKGGLTISHRLKFGSRYIHFVDLLVSHNYSYWRIFILQLYNNRNGFDFLPSLLYVLRLRDSNILKVNIFLLFLQIHIRL